MRLPAPPWEASHFFVRRPDGDEEYRVPAGQRLSSATLPKQRAAVIRRGSAQEAFAQLYSLPFTRDDVAAAHPVDAIAVDGPPRPRRPWRAPAGWTALGLVFFFKQKTAYEMDG